MSRTAITLKFKVCLSLDEVCSWAEKLFTDIYLLPLMPDEDNNFGGSLVLDFRKWWRHVQPNSIESGNYILLTSNTCNSQFKPNAGDTLHWIYHSTWIKSTAELWQLHITHCWIPAGFQPGFKAMYSLSLQGVWTKLRNCLKSNHYCDT